MAVSNKTVKAIIFDVGGVLADNLNWYDGWKEWLKSPNLFENVQKARHNAWMQIKVDGSFSLERFWTEVMKAGEIEDHEWKELNACLESQFRPFFWTLAVADRLKQRGYTIGICSNHSDAWFNLIVDRFRFRDVFTEPDLVIASYAVKAAKPSHAIFDVVMERLKKKHPEIRRNEVVFIDDQTKNTSSAEKYGWQTIQYNAGIHSQYDLIEALQSKSVDAKEHN
mmetsp:Transcript_12871/g.19474  ORF Transcript_12871/g.19474 Transcript_12871/m.19474 type:complete len:224 (+) Transcript_12871:46-717(+)